MLQELHLAQDCPVILKSQWSNGDARLPAGTLATVTDWQVDDDGIVEALYLLVDGCEELCRVERKTYTHWRLVGGMGRWSAAGH